MKHIILKNPLTGLFYNKNLGGFSETKLERATIIEDRPGMVKFIMAHYSLPDNYEIINVSCDVAKATFEIEFDHKLWHPLSYVVSEINTAELPISYWKNHLYDNFFKSTNYKIIIAHEEVCVYDDEVTTKLITIK